MTVTYFLFSPNPTLTAPTCHDTAHIIIDGYRCHFLVLTVKVARDMAPALARSRTWRYHCASTLLREANYPP